MIHSNCAETDHIKTNKAQKSLTATRLELAV